MIFISKEKFTVDGVDVYPDHEDPYQYWYVPGTVKLSERNQKKVLSYFWYTDSATDHDGTGFLNFEVNTAVSNETKNKIKDEIVKKKDLTRNKINLAAVTYTKGSVNFSVLGPVVQEAAQDLDKRDGSVLRQSKEQLVWSAGSSSLVGDNAAVCSVKFTKEGKLAGAMKQVIETGSNSIAAVYSLDFLAMRPSISFKVEGTLDKIVDDFKASIGLNLPLEAFILDVGIQTAWQRIVKSQKLKIEVINFTGEPEEGQKWAEKFLLDYLLKNFFEVDIGNEGKFIPLDEAPDVQKTIEKAKDVEEAAIEKEEKTDTDKDTDKDTDTDQTEQAETGPSKSVKEAVGAAMPFIPKVSIRVSYARLEQHNTIDFLYTEMKAKTYSIAPQALVLEGLGSKPKDYVMAVNRSSDPFGLPYPVAVVLPPDADRTASGVLAINVQARYPAGQSRDKQQSAKLTVSDNGVVTGPNPFPFQYDDKGSQGVEFAVDYVFNPSVDWNTTTSQYSYKGVVESGIITAMPASALEFLTIDILLASNFAWEDNDQVLVTLTSKRWTGDKRVVLQNGKDSSTRLRVRSGKDTMGEPIHYSVSVQRNRKEVYQYGPEVVTNNQITINDRFVDHIPVYFKAAFKDAESAEISLLYEKGDFVWESEVSLEKGGKVECIVPTLEEFKRKSDLKITCEVTPDEGDSFEMVAKGGSTNLVKA